jgi:hypothetical protein
MAVSNIDKPAGSAASRVQQGALAQKKVADWFITNFPGAKQVSSAVAGSTKEDLILEYKGKKINVEIKNANVLSAPITFFDVSARRGQRYDVLDKIANILAFKETTNKGAFEVLMDRYHKKYPDVGYPTDSGLDGFNQVPKSGKVPPELTFEGDEPKALDLLRRKIILNHFRDDKIDYFAINMKDEIVVYWTELSQDVFKSSLISKFPKLKYFSLKTYGGSSRGAMRVGIKVKLK